MKNIEKIQDKLESFLVTATVCTIILTLFFNFIIWFSWNDVSHEEKYVKQGELLSLEKDSDVLIIGKFKAYKDSHPDYYAKVKLNNGVLRINKFNDPKIIEDDNQVPNYGKFEIHTLERNSITGEERVGVDDDRRYTLVLPSNAKIIEVEHDFDEVNR